MKKKGNISLMVLFVLMACSMLGLLTIHFLKSMFLQSSQIFAYQKSYYLAKAGVELSLVQLKNRGVGFETIIEKNSNIIKQNFDVTGGYYFESEIFGKSSMLSNNPRQSSGCSDPFILNTGDSLIIPLFYDGLSGSVWDNLGTGVVYYNKGNYLDEMKLVKNTPGDITIGILPVLGNDLYQTGVFFVTGFLQGDDFFQKFSNQAQELYSKMEDGFLLNWKNDLELQNYLILANKSDHELSFCITLPDGDSLPMQLYAIKSIGQFMGQKIGLEGIYKQPIPSFLVESSLIR